MKNARVVTGALMVSLIANVYLFATRRSGAPESVTSPSGATKARSELPPSSRTGPVLGGAARDPEARERGDALGPEARDREAALTAELLKAQAALEEYRPLEDRFKLSPERSPEIEAQIKPALDKVFPTNLGEPPAYSVECHSSVCVLGIEDDRDHPGWQRALQATAPGMVRSKTFTVHGVYLEVASPDDMAGSRYAQSVAAVIQSSPATAECKRRFPAPGAVELSVVLGADGQVRVTMAGDLADKDFGACLRPVLERAPSAVPPLSGSIRSLPGAVFFVEVPKRAEPPAEPQRRTEHLATTAPLQK